MKLSIGSVFLVAVTTSHASPIVLWGPAQKVSTSTADILTASTSASSTSSTSTADTPNANLTAVITATANTADANTRAANTTGWNDTTWNSTSTTSTAANATATDTMEANATVWNSTVSDSTSGNITATEVTAAGSRWLPSGTKVRGVNLGTAFLFEPWMATSEWEKMGCSAQSGQRTECSCVEQLGQDQANEVFQEHYDTFITGDDINEIKSYGLNTVRIPLGFWLFDNLVEEGEHYPRGALKYLDRLVGQAAHAGIYVILDLHAAPGSQAANQEFSGRPGPADFFQQHNYERAAKFLSQMTNRIHTNDNYRTVGVLEVLNEPDRENGEDMRKKYYPLALKAIRDAEKDVGDGDVLKIQFMSKTWGSGNPHEFLPKPLDANLLYDNHRYYEFRGDGVKQSKQGLLNEACSYNALGNNPKIITGETSLMPTDKSIGADQKDFYKKLWSASAQVFEQSGGWIYWSWKTQGTDYRWSYQEAVREGVIDQDAAKAIHVYQCDETWAAWQQ